MMSDLLGVMKMEFPETSNRIAVLSARSRDKYDGTQAQDHGWHIAQGDRKYHYSEIKRAALLCGKAKHAGALLPPYPGDTEDKTNCATCRKRLIAKRARVAKQVALLSSIFKDDGALFDAKVKR